MDVISGKRVTINPLKLEDVYDMQDWGKHDDPLFDDYNFPQLTEEEIKEWFKIKTSKKNKICYSVKNEESKVVGYLTIKDIKRIRKQATLGIVFNPNHLNKGYGTETITTFLEYFFKDFNMNTMKLEVAKFNRRAIRCYEKCGFKKTREFLKKLENQNIDIFGDDRYKEIRECFIMKNGSIYAFFYEMKIDKYYYHLMLSTNK